MKLNDLRYIVENVGYYITEDNHAWPGNVTWPWDSNPDLFPPPQPWPPVPGQPTYVPPPPAWFREGGGSSQQWREYYRQITSPPYVPHGDGIPWDPVSTNPNNPFPLQFPPDYQPLDVDNPLGIRPDTPDNPLTRPELLDPLGDNPMDADPNPDGSQPQNPFDGMYQNRPWHLDENGNWVYDPNRPGGYSQGERDWFDRQPYDPGPPPVGRNPANNPPGSIPNVDIPPIPSGPGYYLPGDLWVPMIESPPGSGYWAPDFNGDGLPDVPPIEYNPNASPTPRPGGTPRPGTRPGFPFGQPIPGGNPIPAPKPGFGGGSTPRPGRGGGRGGGGGGFRPGRLG